MKVFALTEEGKVVHINDAPHTNTGAKYYNENGESLITSKGKSTSHHFKHKTNGNWTNESPLHYNAKMYFSTKYNINIDGFKLSASQSKVEKKSVDKYTPDITFYDDNGSVFFLIEIVVTSDVSGHKYDEIKFNGIPLVKLYFNKNGNYKKPNRVKKYLHQKEYTKSKTIQSKIDYFFKSFKEQEERNSIVKEDINQIEFRNFASETKEIRESIERVEISNRKIEYEIDRSEKEKGSGYKGINRRVESVKCDVVRISRETERVKKQINQFRILEQFREKREQSLF